jgi:ribonuclease D
MQAIADATPLPEDALPVKDNRPGLSTDAGLVADLLKLLLKIRCKEEGVAAKLIARNGELEALAAGRRDGLSILNGWRHDLFGRDALDLVEGRIGFSVENNRLRMTPLS